MEAICWMVKRRRDGAGYGGHFALFFAFLLCAQMSDAIFFFSEPGEVRNRHG